MHNLFKVLRPVSRHPILVALVGTALSAWLIAKCVTTSSPPAARPSVSAAAAPPDLAEVEIRPPKRKQVEENADHFDPLTNFNDWARSVRALDNRYLERDEFLKRMHGKRVRWRGVVANAGEEGWDVDLVLRTAQEADPFYTVFHVQIPNTLRARVHALHDGDLVEVKGRYAGEIGLLQQPRVYGESLELISAAAEPFPTGPSPQGVVVIK